MPIKIYTRTGDKGQTSLFGGKRVSKASERVDTYGTVDELNSMIGVVIAHLTQKHKSISRELTRIQNDLFDVGASLANPTAKPQESLIRRAKEFEHLIDDLTKKMPEIRNFILPGGGKAGSYLHMARTICRRAERRITALSKKEQVDDEVIKYFNRLSDLLFTMARFVNQKDKKKETVWRSNY